MNRLSTGKLLEALAWLSNTQGRWTEAEDYYKRAFAIRDKALRKGHPHTTELLWKLAAAYHHRGLIVQAEPWYERCIESARVTFEESDPFWDSLLDDYAELLYALGNTTKAESMLQWKREMASKRG